MNTFTTFDVVEARVNKIWDTHALTDPNTAVVLVLNTNDHTTVSIHGNRADMERIYTALDKYLGEVHKEERQEREAELYAEAMMDRIME